MGRHGRRVSDDGRATALSRQCKRTREQLTLWRANRDAWDAERDDGGLTASYWRARKRIGRELRPFSIVQVIPPEVFSTFVAARMAGVVALCLVLRHFEVIAWSYEQWAEYLGCSPRTAGTAARELARKGWIEIRAHFAEFHLAGKRQHAQLPSTFAPGYMMRVAFDVWEAQGRRAKEQWTAVRSPVGAAVIHNLEVQSLPDTCQPKRETRSSDGVLLANVSYGSLGFPQATGAISSRAGGSGSLFPPTASPLVIRGMEALAREGGEPVQQWAQAIALTLQDALRQAFPAHHASSAPPKTGRRYAAGKRPPDIVRWRPWIKRRTEWRNRDQLRREEIRGQLRLLQLREWGVAPNGPPPAHLSPAQVAYWYNHERSCVCAVCFAAREAMTGRVE